MAFININIFYYNLSWLLHLTSPLKLHQRTSDWITCMCAYQGPVCGTLFTSSLCSYLRRNGSSLSANSTLIHSSQGVIHFKLIFPHNAQITAHPIQTDISFYLKGSITSTVILSFKRISQFPQIITTDQLKFIQLLESGRLT